jgi:hypothetical protein
VGNKKEVEQVSVEVGSFAWQVRAYEAIPRWRILARYRRRVAMERAQERCIDAVEGLRRRLLGRDDR